MYWAYIAIQVYNNKLIVEKNLKDKLFVGI